jgi:hypothetical protein
MDSYKACSIVEGFADFEPTAKQELQAWAYLIKTRQCWSLQGWYGRTATELIRSGYISETGRVNWRYIRATTDLL